MEKEQIVRDDFPTSRKGWDPEAVRAHLEAIAASLPTSDVSLADAAASRVAGVIAAAEAAAAEIEDEARAEAESSLAEARARADRLLTAAREEAEGIVTAARTDASDRVAKAKGAVESLVSQAEELRNRVGSLGEALSIDVGVPASVEVEPEVEPAEVEPDPEPAEAEPAPAPIAAAPDPIEEESEPESAALPGPEVDSPTSTEDLIAQLRGAEQAATEAPAEERTAPDATVDRAAVRLVALNMALEGADREAITAQIADEFGDVPDLGELLDDVLARTA